MTKCSEGKRLNSVDVNLNTFISKIWCELDMIRKGMGIYFIKKEKEETNPYMENGYYLRHRQGQQQETTNEDPVVRITHRRLVLTN